MRAPTPQLSLAKALFDWLRSADQAPKQARQPRGVALVNTGQKSIALHKARCTKGMPRPQREVVITHATYADLSRYPGHALREIRKSATNFRGEIRR
jgi:hypothetical protein